MSLTNNVGGLFAVILAVLLLASLSSSQVTDVKVQIVNSPPKVGDVHPSSVVKSGGTDIVWCTATAEDLNSFKDIKTTSAFIGIPSDAGFIQRVDTSFMESQQVSVVKGNVIVGFAVSADTRPGEWNCVVEVADGAEDKATNKSAFKIYPESCGNKKQDSGEENVDCGGPCMPCHCGNGVQDDGEAAVDCGGPCGPCIFKGALALTVPETLTVGEVLSVQVKSGNMGIASLLRVTRPDGKTTVYKTDDSGVINVETDQTGGWKIQADMLGYKGAEAGVQVKTSPIVYVAVAIALLAIAVLALAILRTKKKREPQP